MPRTPKEAAEIYKNTLETGKSGRGILESLFDTRDKETKKEDEAIEKAALIERVRTGKDEK